MHPRSMGIAVALFSLRFILFSFQGTGSDRCSMTIDSAAVAPARFERAYSSVGSERTPDKREVGSSTLPRPTKLRMLNAECSMLNDPSPFDIQH
jgi:hypothetical protein